ncbi:MAG: Rrf2 family transcriptional regulator [Coriobacteriia bacterium]
MRMTARSEYGVLALIELAARQDGEPVSARELAEARGIPLPFLEQLLVALRKAGIVSSTRGARGGFALARPAEEITVLDAVEALEGPVEASVCDTSADCPHENRCAAAGVWRELTSALSGVLSGYDLQRLAERQRALDAAETKG